jgi:hypothetical protein
LNNPKFHSKKLAKEKIEIQVVVYQLKRQKARVVDFENQTRLVQGEFIGAQN